MNKFVKTAAFGLATVFAASTMTIVGGVAAPGAAEAGVFSSIKKAAGGVVKGATGIVKGTAGVVRGTVGVAGSVVKGAAGVGLGVAKGTVGAVRVVGGTVIRAEQKILTTAGKAAIGITKAATAVPFGVAKAAVGALPKIRISVASAPRYSTITQSASRPMVRDHRR